MWLLWIVTPSQKDCVEGNEGSLKDGADTFVVSLHSLFNI